MLESPELLITKSEHTRVCNHYHAAGPLMDRHFHDTPMIAVTYPKGLGHDPVYHKSLVDPPKTIPVVQVRTSTGEHTYASFGLHALTWLTAGRFSVEFESWTPLHDDPQHAAYGRLVLEPNGRSGEPQTVDAVRIVLAALAEHGLQAIPILNGSRGIALWIPFDDAPGYAELATWLRMFSKHTAAQHPDLLTTANFIADRGDRVSIGTRSNHPGMGSILPYSLRGSQALEVAVPCPARELGSRSNGDVTDENFADFIATHGDEFAALRQAIPDQRFAALPRAVESSREVDRAVTIALSLTPQDPRGSIIGAALDVLSDGKPRTSSDILTEAEHRGLLPHSTTPKHLYTALHEYILRTLGAGRIPELVQLPGTSEFRINRPADDWPTIELPAPPRWMTAEEVSANSSRLRKAATGDDPTAFERAVCDAFGSLGFLAEHYGGNGQPDGILTAPLGTEGYRVVLECKTASPNGIVNNPRPEEAAKFRESYDAGYSILIGPAFGHTSAFEDELAKHAVALWTVDDLVQALENQISPDDLRPTLAPGHARAALDTILWEREHGHIKRVEVIAALLAQVGWEVQTTLAHGVPVPQTPPLTKETLLILVDEALLREGVASGVTRAEAEEGISLALARHRLRATKDGYVVTTPATV